MIKEGKLEKTYLKCSEMPTNRDSLIKLYSKTNRCMTVLLGKATLVMTNNLRSLWKCLSKGSYPLSTCTFLIESQRPSFPGMSIA